VLWHRREGEVVVEKRARSAVAGASVARYIATRRASRRSSHLEIARRPRAPR